MKKQAPEHKSGKQLVEAFEKAVIEAQHKMANEANHHLVRRLRQELIEIATWAERPKKIDTPTPKWKHDCDKCIFLGQTIGGGCLTDLYYHPGELPTLIARFGDNGPDYYSSHPDYIPPNGHAELFVALTLWRMKKERDQR